MSMVEMVVPRDPDDRHRWMSVILRASIAYQTHTIRRARNWSQEQLAFRANLSTQTIIRLEDPSGEWPSLTTLKEVASAFDCALVCRFTSWPDFVAQMVGLIPPHAFDADRVDALTKPDAALKEGE